MVQSMSWDYCGTTLATTCKDKKPRLFDPRAGADAVSVADSHAGVKGEVHPWGTFFTPTGDLRANHTLTLPVILLKCEIAVIQFVQS
ncbi:hypothetical protein ACM66B_001577 [Microbotryomycetes sp. NB124-2]